MGSTTLLRRRLLEAAGTEDGVRLACEWVRIKVAQQAGISAISHALVPTVPRHWKPSRQLEKMAAIIEGIHDGTLDELRGSIMGLEGVAGREYFAALSLALPDRFRFQGRSRSPAKDEFNSLLN